MCIRDSSDMEPSDVRSMCCRLRLDLRELRKKSGGFFGSGESTGSVGVVTINLPPVSYTHLDVYKRQVFRWGARSSSRCSLSRSRKVMAW